jgi:hypothetical protein
LARQLGIGTDLRDFQKYNFKTQFQSRRANEPDVLVTGQLLNAPFPNFIKLETQSGELSWHSASDTWIPEDGLYDHLVLKVDKD